jgi:hypothetical protein
VLAFDAPGKPPPLASISEPFADVDFSDLPTAQTYTARDGGLRAGSTCHGNFGRKGDIDYIGQDDLVAVLRPLHPSASFSLIGLGP